MGENRVNNGVKMVQNRSKWVKIGSKMASKWCKIGQHRVRMGQSGSEWVKMDQYMGQNGSKWVKKGQNESK